MKEKLFLIVIKPESFQNFNKKSA